MGIDTPKIVDENVEAIASAEKFTNLQKAVGEYSEERIQGLSKIISERFNERPVKVLDPGATTDTGLAYRNLIHELVAGRSESPQRNDDLNFTMFGMAIKKVMEENAEFDKFIREFIKTAEQDAAIAWEGREELYQRYLDADREQYGPNSKQHPRTYLLDPNDGMYTQGKIMKKFILGEM